MFNYYDMHHEIESIFIKMYLICLLADVYTSYVIALHIECPGKVHRQFLCCRCVCVCVLIFWRTVYFHGSHGTQEVTRLAISVIVFVICHSLNLYDQ